MTAFRGIITLKHIFVLAFCVGISATLANALQWRDCGSEATIFNVFVSSCEDQSTCPMKKGSNVSLVVWFEPNKQITKATASMRGIMAGVPLPFPLQNPDGCKDSGLKCPLVGYESYNYTNSVYMHENYPTVKLLVEWELRDQNGDVIWCILVPAKIIN
ncbi:NPC intracellular cholesterol transporter 2 homolog a-like [Branchiostoma floridae]|uniref:NPC intracellular cholesterol transporter 2 n=1 Tax=Branchiostoma floridae TaxID=7739 RepID=A0A9J7MX66_BRAFL|nr:NPC intracellular cholesterol transporter 2 homolog a-like [Branchiostoma floridae]